MKKTPVSLLILPLLAALILASGCASKSDSGEVLVNKSLTTVERMTASAKNTQLMQLVSKAEGILIFPDVVKAGLFLAVRGGDGVMLIKNESGGWNGPAFYGLGGVSYGLQIGMIHTSVIFVFTEKEPLLDAMNGKELIGADAGVYLADAGGNKETSAFTKTPGIFCFTDVDGLFAGVSFEGGALETKGAINELYYKSFKVTAEKILLQGLYENSYADSLKEKLTVVNPVRRVIDENGPDVEKQAQKNSPE